MMKQLFLFFIYGFSLAAFGADKAICVAIIAKNDTKIDAAQFNSCVESLKGIADCICISVQGASKHWTPDFFQHQQFLGQLYVHEAKDERDPTTIAAQDGQSTLTKFGFPLEESYILILQPNQLCLLEGPFDKESLEQEAYLIFEQSALLGCYRYHPYLFSAKLSPAAIGQMSVSGLSDQVQISSAPKLRSLRLRSAQSQRPEEALNFLQRAQQQEPQNTQLLLSLANTARSLQQFAIAVEAHKKIIQLNRFPEEVWLSKYQIGECFDAEGKWADALYWYLEAFQCNPYRAEPLFKVANRYRLDCKNDLAYLFAKFGKDIPHLDWNVYPSDLLQDYQFDEELSIASFYTRYKEVGYDACDDVLLRKSVVESKKQQTYNNILFYVKNLKAHHEKIQIPLPRIDADEEHYYVPLNPSIQKTDHGYNVICRAVNFTQQGAKYYQTVDRHGIIYTKNFLIQCDREFNILSQREIVENLARERYNISHPVKGLEDCRIIDWNQRSWFTCSTFDTNPTSAIQISLCKLPRDLSGKGPLEVEALIPLQGPDPHRCEKNWLPFIKDGDLHLIYSSSPFTILKPNVKTGDCQKVLELSSQWDFSQFRGSAAPVPFDDGQLMLVHEVIFMPDYTRKYLHRFVLMDADFKVTKISKPFTFLHLGIEYCVSMAISHSGDQFILPIGVEDKEAYLCFVDFAEVRSMLRDLPLIFNPY